MFSPVSFRLLLAAVAAAAAGSAAAQPFAAPGAQATLTVDYAYSSSGKRSSAGMYDPYVWRARRDMTLGVDLAAQAPTALPTVHTIEGKQMAGLKNQVAKAESAAAKMAPMMAGAERIMAKCGEDEACISREAQKMGAAMQGTPEMAAAMGAKKDIAELTAPAAARYQAWRATAQRGLYVIDESVHVSIPDPICAGKPRNRCTRTETRQGAGAVPVPPEAYSRDNRGAAAGIGAIEVDAAGKTLAISLPIALGTLPFTETIVSDEPAGTHDRPIPTGPRARQLHYRVSAAGSGGMEQPFTVPLKGGWRTQEGERVVNLKGRFGDGGTLRIRWRFEVK